MDYRLALVIIGTLVTFIGYVPYFRDIFRGSTKPHAFSWLLWALLMLIAFAAQLAAGGGLGAWVIGINGLLCAAIFLLALRKGDRKYPLIDWVALIFALSAIPLWYFTKDPLWSVILVSVIDGVAFFPTYRKSYHKPHEETLMSYGASGVAYLCSIAALESYSVTTWLYPATLFITNSGFIVMTVWRRKIGRRR